MNLDLSRWKNTIAAADLGSFRQASLGLSIKQPALSVEHGILKSNLVASCSDV